jgi:hypothetical protein
VTNHKIAATGGGARLFDNGFFHAVEQHPHIRMYIHKTWVVPPPAGIGKTPTMSKSITMSNVGDAEKAPMRTMILLKAWMLWRVRQHPEWLASNDSRQRLFAEEAHQLCLELRRMQPQADGLLGNLAGTKMLCARVPDLVGTLASDVQHSVIMAINQHNPAERGSTKSPKPATCGSSTSSHYDKLKPRA